MYVLTPPPSLITFRTLLTNRFFFLFLCVHSSTTTYFLTHTLHHSDFTSPFFGSVFRMQNHVMVSSIAKGTSRADPDGEWPSLMYANWLLDQRFGQRVRPYLAHFVKTYSAPILQEVAAIWGEELTYLYIQYFNICLGYFTY